MADLEDSIHYFGLIQRCNKSWSEAFMALQNGCSVKLGRGMFQNIKTSTRETTFEKLLGTGKGRHRGLSFNGADPQHKSLTSPLKLKSPILFPSFFGMQNLGFLFLMPVPAKLVWILFTSQLLFQEPHMSLLSRNSHCPGLISLKYSKMSPEFQPKSFLQPGNIFF